MNVLMFTNTFAPHVGGVARSVGLLAGALRDRGHRVLVVAPSFGGHAEDTPGVLRFPALHRVAGTEYSLPIPLGRVIRDEIDAFGPDIVHSHHPFLLGDTALRIAAERGLPVVDTYHTRYDHYVRSFAGNDARLARLAWSLSAGYCNLCDAVIAPSASIAEVLGEHGVTAPVHVIPTGIDVGALALGDRARGRAALGIDTDAFVVGHLGRLAPEKNLEFLAEALVGFLAGSPQACAAIAGTGAAREAMLARFSAAGFGSRLHLRGVLGAAEIADFLAALDVFAFASLSETQGIVLAEAMAAGRPIVALDAAGTREAVLDGETGFLLNSDASAEAFAAALAAVQAMIPADRREMENAAHRRAAAFSVDRMCDRVLDLYREVLAARRPRRDGIGRWTRAWLRVAEEGTLFRRLVVALAEAMLPAPDDAQP
jgi:glycosyltransferase involved in cell wall biosynthesis